MHHRAIESAVEFCACRDILTLARLRADIRAKSEIARMCRILREALVCDGYMDYIAELWHMTYALSCVCFADATLEQLMQRGVAHALMNRSRSLAQWLLHERGARDEDANEYSPMNQIKNFYSIIGYPETALVARDNCVREICAVCTIVASSYATRAHYEFFNRAVMAWTRVTQVTHIPYQFFNHLTSRHNSASASEWIECMFARDVDRACALIPISREATRKLFDDLHTEKTAIICAQGILVPMGPRYIEYALSRCAILTVIAQIPSTSVETFEKCLAIIRAKFARAQYNMTRGDECELIARPKRRSTISVGPYVETILFAAANNPDDAVFAHVLDIARASDCIPRTCKISVQSYHGDAHLLRAIRRLDDAGINTASDYSFEKSIRHNQPHWIVPWISSAEALKRVDTIMAHLPREEKQKKYMHRYSLLVEYYGESMKRMIESHVTHD